MTMLLRSFMPRTIIYSQLCGLFALALANYCDRHSYCRNGNVVQPAAWFGFAMMIVNPIIAIAVFMIALKVAPQSGLKLAAIVVWLLLAILVADVIAFIPLIQ